MSCDRPSASLSHRSRIFYVFIGFLVFTIVSMAYKPFPFAYAVCSDPVLDDTTCSNGQTITATFVCTEGNEGNRAYTVPWKNITNVSNQVVLETDVGTTPVGAGTPFFESFTCPSEGIMDANVSLLGTNLEGTTDFSMVSAASNELIIVNISVTSEVLVGKSAGFKFSVVDENGKTVNGVRCSADIEDGTGVPITGTDITEIITRDGVGEFSGVTSIAALSEGRGFVLEIRCTCGESGTGNVCFDEDSTLVNLSIGSVEFPFSTGVHLIVNSVTDKAEYVPDEPLFICANVTNPVNRTMRHLRIKYDYRCNGDDQARNRVLIDALVEDRGIDSNQTQMQCAVFRVPDFVNIEQGANECYGRTEVVVLDEVNNQLVEYHAVTPSFNITSSSIHPVVSCSRLQRLRYQCGANTSSFDVGVKNVHVVLPLVLDDFDSPATSVDSFSISFANGSATPFSSGLEVHRFAPEGSNQMVDRVVIVIADVNTTLDDSFLVTVELNGGDITSTPLLLLGSAFILLVAIAEWKRDRWLYLFSSILPLMIFFFSLTNNPFSSFTEFQLDRLWLLFTLILTTYVILRAGLGEWPDRAPAR